MTRCLLNPKSVRNVCYFVQDLDSRWGGDKAVAVGPLHWRERWIIERRGLCKEAIKMRSHACLRGSRVIIPGPRPLQLGNMGTSTGSVGVRNFQGSWFLKHGWNNFKECKKKKKKSVRNGWVLLPNLGSVRWDRGIGSFKSRSCLLL